jgi:hypothetical protein
MSRVTATTSGVRWLPIVLGVFAVAVGVYVSVTLLADSDWNPTVFIKFPGGVPEEMAYANEHLRDVVPADALGHDGKFYFKQAMDPFYLSPDEHAYLLDRPAYRAQRMVYPTLAGGFGLLPAQAIAWSMVVLNVLALGIGTWLTAILAIELGISGWFGLAFVLNPGVLVSSFIDTGEVFAMVFFVGGALFLLRERYLATAILLTLAALSRESMLLCALGAALYIWRTKRVVPKVLALPFVASAAWWLFLRSRLGYLETGLQDTKAIGVPFKGFIEAIQTWLSQPGNAIDMILGVSLMVIAFLVAWRGFRNSDMLGYLAGGFLIIAVLMVEGIWLNYFDASRALAPVITAYILMVPASRIKRVEPSDTEALSDMSAP